MTQKNKAAQELARLGRGVPKNFSKAERQRRRERMLALNDAIRALRRKENRRKP